MLHKSKEPIAILEDIMLPLLVLHSPRKAPHNTLLSKPPHILKVKWASR